MCVKCRAKRAQLTDEHWWHSRNIRVKAILLHLQQNQAINATQHSSRDAFIRLTGLETDTFGAGGLRGNRKNTLVVKE